jgi:hypothetical protein
MYPKCVQEEINILTNLSIGTRHQAAEIPTRLEEFNKMAMIYEKMAQLISEFNWNDYGKEETDSSGVLQRTTL